MSKKVNSVVYSILSANGTVSGLVGDRIYPGIVLQGAAMPNVAIRTIATTPTHDKDGSNKDRALVQVSCYDIADNYSALTDLADAIRTALDRIGSGTYGTVEATDIRLDDQSEVFNSESKIHQIDQDYLITYKR